MGIMKKYIYLFFMLMCIVSCEKPEEGLVAEKSVNADIVRFRIYQNQNVFFDGTIDQEGYRTGYYTGRYRQVCHQTASFGFSRSRGDS